MGELAKLGFLATNVLMLVVGVRLLWAWRRARTAPELAIGTAYSLGSFGLLLLVTMTLRALAGNEVFPLWMLGHALIQLAQSALILGMWRVFRPNSRRAAACAWTGSVVCLAPVGWSLYVGRPDLYNAVTTHQVITTASMVLSYGWVSVESLLYMSRLMRRLALDLTDSLTVARFGWWGCGSAFALMAGLISLFSVVVYNQGLTHIPWVFLLTQAVLVASALCTWFAFFPPAFYQKFLETQDPQPAS